MVRRCTACKCVRTPSSIFKLNQICFVESSLVMRHIFLSKTRIVSIRAVRGCLQRHWGWRKQEKVILTTFYDVMGHRPELFLASGQVDQSASLYWNSATYILLSQWEDTRVLAGEIMVASPRQCTCSQHPLSFAIFSREKHRCTWTTFLINWSCILWRFSFIQTLGDHQRNTFWRV